MSIKNLFVQACKVIVALLLALGVLFSAFFGGNLLDARAQQAIWSSASYAGKLPYVLAPERNTAEEAINIGVENLNRNLVADFKYSIVGISQASDWAYADLLRINNEVSGEVIPSSGDIILAHKGANGLWSSRSSVDHELYNDWLDQMPPTLLDDLVKDIVRWVPAPEVESLASTSASVSGHYLPWPAPIGARVTQNYNNHGLGQIDFVIDTADIVATKDGTIVYVNDTHWKNGSSAYATYNNVVVIRHSISEYTIYLHLKQNTVPSWIKAGCPNGHIGQTCSVAIQRGNKIGEMGSTGWSTGLHLHLSTASSFYVDTNNPDWADEDGDGNTSELTYTAFTTNHITADFVEYSYDTLKFWPNDPNNKVFSQNGGGVCSGPSLQNPAEGFISQSQTINFSWSALSQSGCTNGYTFRIKDVSTMDSGGNLVDGIDQGVGGTSIQKTISSQWNNRDLYWGVKAANATNASWSVRKFRIESTPPPSGWHVEYFNSRDLNNRCFDGSENSTYIFKNWGNGSPESGCNSDNFSARFTRTFNFSNGNYNFHCQHDDGCRIFVGGVERLNAWWDSSFTGHDWSGSLSGNHEVKIEFYDSGGDARLEAFWSGPGFLPTGPACTSNEWCGSYYGNKDLAGTPALNRNEGTANINYDWENSGVGFGFPNDNFSVRWQRNVSFAAGRYRFHIRVDDGGRLWVNNNKVIDEWRDQGAQEYTADVDLNGVIPVSFEYYENGGGAVAEMWWETLAQPPSANFDAWPLSGPAPFTTTLHIVDMSGITNCSWNYGDGQSSTICTQLHDHTYNNPGSYTVSLTVSGPGGSNPMTRFNYITVNPTLNVNKTGIGSGNVTSNPSGINCGATCSYSFPYNTPVTLSASAATGSTFTGWSGAACSGTGPCTVAMSAAISVSANFNLQPSYTLGVNKGGTGSGTVISNPSGINCGSDCSELYTSGTVVTLTANPTLGHTFAGWSGDADCADGQVTMNAGKTCTATFNSINYTLTVNKTGAGSGTVTSNPAGINCGSDCSETYALGIVVVLTATPATDAIFAGWSGDADCSDGQVTMSASKICTATFNSAPHPSSLLRNPSFEDDSNNDGKPDIWSTNAKFTRSSDIAAMNGTYVGKLRTTDNSGVTIQQVVQSLTPGTTYDFSSWTNIPGTSDTFTFKLQVKWRNASNSAISTQIIKTYTASTNGWDQVTASLVAPAGTTNALIQMIVSSLNGTIYIDDFSFGSSTVQPLPDLLIESITSIPANPQVNEFVDFSVVVRNQGQVDALGFWVDLFIDNSFPSDCSGIGQAYQYVDSLAAGASQTLVIGYTGFGNEGSHAVHGITDTNCSIEENDEDNNKNSINVMAGGDLDLIFANSFEDDDCFVTQWTACVDDSGDLQFTDPPAPLKDNASMIITVDDNNPVYVTSDHPDAERRYRGRFYFDPNSISMVSGNAHFILYGYNGTSKVILRVEFRNSSGSYQLRAGLLNDASSWTNSSWSTITDAPHFIEFDWRAASVTGANNGGLTLWIDGVQKANLAAVDNDTWRIDRVRLGAVNGIDAGTRGTYYFDAFESRRETYIGP